METCLAGYIIHVHVHRPIHVADDVLYNFIKLIDLEEMDRQHRSRTTELASTRTLEKCWLLTSGMNLRAVIRS